MSIKTSFALTRSPILYRYFSTYPEIREYTGVTSKAWIVPGWTTRVFMSRRSGLITLIPAVAPCSLLPGADLAPFAAERSRECSHPDEKRIATSKVGATHQDK